ncbi:MFS transporter [Helicobacter sp. 12S02232-10]|uniref:MFS transporter n=1 Tax=Helicobacter sp. 12S02232-10 TaxID=1476197 RepID=UPI0015DFD982|nr:MFS transporter [Helicobacter sp. 12S02232-10]
MMQRDCVSPTKLENRIKKIVHKPFFKIALFSTTSMTVLGSVVIAPSLPALQSHFQNIAGIDFLSKLVLTLPALFVMLFSPLSGYLLDRYGRIKFLFPAMAIWSLSGFSGFFLDNIYLILVSRAIFGIATAFVMTGATALVGDYYLGEDRQKALGLQGFATAVGSAVFISLGGYLSSIDWRYPFLAYLLGIAIAIFAYTKLFEPHRKKTKKTHKEVEGSNQKFNFLMFLPVYLLVFFCMVAYYISPTQIPFFIVHNLGKNGDIVGISMSASSIAYGVFSLFYNRFRNIWSIYGIYALGLFLMGTCFLLLYVFHNYLIVMVSLMFLGAGGGLLIVNSSSYLLSIAPEMQRAKALGFFASAIFLGQFFSPLMTQPIVDRMSILGLFLIFTCLLYMLGLFFIFKSRMKKNFRKLQS